MGWPWKKRSQVSKKAEEWEKHAYTDGEPDSLFRQLGKDLNEEARVKAVAIAKSQYAQQPLGGWIEKAGRKHEDGVIEGLVKLLFRPDQFDPFVLLAAMCMLVHMMLLGSWLVVEYDEFGTLSVEDIEAQSLRAASVSDVATRFATMYAVGHLIWFVLMCHVAMSGDMRPHTMYYMVLMVICVIVGGPACAFAASAHCQAQAKTHMAAAAAGELVMMRSDERKVALADCMQWVYLVVLATLVAATTSALGTPALDPTYDGSSSAAMLSFYFWPMEIASLTTLDWLTSFTAMMLVDWAAVFIFGLLLALSYKPTAGAPGLLSVSGSWDVLTRTLVILVTSFPNPYLGLGLYLMLDTRHIALNPLLPQCTGGLKGPQKPRAMGAWRAREAGTSLL